MTEHQLTTVMPVSATAIAIQLPVAMQDSDWVDCTCSSNKCISISHLFDVQHI